MPQVTTRIAAISGGLGDIGQACAIALASQGAEIAIGDVKENHRVSELKSKVERLGRRFLFSPVDVADVTSVRRWFDAIEAHLGIANIVIANAAIVEPCTFQEMTPEIWQRHLDVNLTGAMQVANTAAARMVAAGGPGCIVLMGSWAAEAAHSHIPAYCVAMLCRLLALQYAANGIRVNEVAPGLVDAGLSRKLFDEDPALRERMVGPIPLKRMLTAEDVAWYVSQVCDPKNLNMTGATLTCDGGISLITAAERT